MTTVYVGMSGGVDSSLSAALLVEQGYKVVGVYMKNWTQDLPGMKCPWADDLADAKRVAVQLGIELKVYDFQTEYRQRVVDYMIDEYKAGRTPNPDIMCNQEVKFKLFLEAALADGADMIATGHYATVQHKVSTPTVNSPAQRTLQRAGGSFAATGFADKSATGADSEDSVAHHAPRDINTATLYTAKDINKDQTYFLYRVSAEALSKTIFPLGEYTKPEVRRMAEERGLVTAGKKDSQGICFVGSVGIREFLSQFVETEPGETIDRDQDKVVGHHDGAIFYTLGQRHGLNIGGGLPYYVVYKDMDSNKVYVSRNINDESMWRQQVELRDIHWIYQPPTETDSLQARFRHRGELRDVILDGGSSLKLDNPERSVAPGQSVVIYRGNEVLGGGIVAG